MTTISARTRVRAVLLGGGLAGLLAVAGCSSSSSSSPQTSPSTAASQAQSTQAAAQPSWAAGLGSGVTVTGPASVAAGNDSPGAAVQGVLAAVNAKNYAGECAFLLPSAQSSCASGASELSPTDAPSVKAPAVGYVAIKGSQALVGTTGTYCTPGATPQCFTNNDPAAIFSGGKSFSTLWTEANNGGSDQNVYTLAPCVQVNGKWYVNAGS
jgi:hypothetical protein